MPMTPIRPRQPRRLVAEYGRFLADGKTHQVERVIA